MKILSPLFLFTLFVGPALAAGACPAPENLHLSAVDSHFVQERAMQGMAKPLVSQGRLQVDKNEVIWHMTEPFDIETRMTASGITQSIDKGPPEPLAPGTAEFGTMIVRSLGSLMRGEWQALEGVFDVKRPAAASGAPWSVTLTPRDPAMKSALGAILVEGCTAIDHVTITRANGDRDLISFQNGAP